MFDMRSRRRENASAVASGLVLSALLRLRLLALGKSELGIRSPSFKDEEGTKRVDCYRRSYHRDAAVLDHIL